MIRRVILFANLLEMTLFGYKHRSRVTGNVLTSYQNSMAIEIHKAHTHYVLHLSGVAIAGCDIGIAAPPTPMAYPDGIE
jgi:hypothetical protein